MSEKLIADYILDIGKSSKGAIRSAIKSVIKNLDDKDKIETNLKAIRDVLHRPTVAKRKTVKGKVVKRRSTSMVPSDMELFTSKVLPQIRESIGKYERMQNSVDDSEWNLNLDFIKKFDKFELSDMDSIKTTHTEVMEQESLATNLHLVIAYHRGLIYLTARKFLPGDAVVKQWYTDTFKVAYVTIYRYIAFAMMIKTYPRLLFCGLAFTQFSNHHNRIKNHLITDTELANRLKLEFNMSVNNKSLDIMPVKVDSFPETKLPFVVNPDHIYEDNDWYYKDTDVNPKRAMLVDKEIEEFFKYSSEVEQERQNICMMENISMSDSRDSLDLDMEPISHSASASTSASAYNIAYVSD